MMGDTMLHFIPRGEFFGRKEKGAALITGLLFMVVLTLISVAAIRTSTLEEKMSGNTKDREMAFQAAEAALKDGELFLEQNALALPSFNGSNGLYHYANAPAPDPLTWTGWAASGRAYGGTINGVSSQPLYIIEQMASVPSDPTGSVQFGPSSSTNMFRVIARGVGGTSAAVVVLQSNYRL